MKILVNDIAASSGGAKSILLDFYRYLLESNDENEWYFLLGEALIEETEHIHVILLPEVKKSWCRRIWFDLISSRKVVSQIAPDVILSLQNTAIACGHPSQYIYVHQPLPFQRVKRFSFMKKAERIYAVYQYLIGFLIKESIRRAKGVFVQTQWMNDAVCAYIDPAKVRVIAPSVPAGEKLSDQNVCIRQNRFFYPAGNMIYKNHDLLYRSVEALIADGFGDFQVDLTLEKTNACEAEQTALNCVGMLSRETVMENYKTQILVFPSYIETFGLPLAEARLMKGMIFAADTPFAREILDGYKNAWFFDPFDYLQLKELMKKAICGELQYEPVEEAQVMPESTWAELINTLKEAL